MKYLYIIQENKCEGEEWCDCISTTSHTSCCNAVAEFEGSSNCNKNHNFRVVRRNDEIVASM